MRVPIIRLFDASGTDIVTTYVAGSTIYVGRAQAIRSHARIVTAPASAIAQVVFRWQGTLDPSDPDGWEDVTSRRDDNGVVELEHTYTAPVGPPASHAFMLDVRGLLAVRLLARATGGVGQAGDEIVVEGVSW
jgi:hypothetical protein